MISRFTSVKFPPYLSFIKFLLRRSRDKIRLKHSPYIFSRTACLGNDSLKLSGVSESKYVFNLQKGRSDLLLRSYSSNQIKPFFGSHKFIGSRDIRDMVWQQSNTCFHDFPKPAFILFDSFSDLTDLCFTAPSQTEFYCHKSDLKTTSEDHGIIAHGLLDLDGLETLYENLFNNFELAWGDVRIIFIHFPTKLETRQFYIERANRIKSAIENLARQFSNLYSIEIPTPLVNPEINLKGEVNSFPYHYSPETKEFVANKISEILFVKH
jgi:hypothetical protein